MLKSQIYKLGIYEIFEILKFLELNIKICGSKSRIYLVYYDRLYDDNGRFAICPCFVKIQRSMELYGKWGNYFKKNYFLWKTMQIEIRRKIRNQDEFTIQLCYDSSIILSKINYSWNVRFLIIYETNSKYSTDKNNLLNLSFFWNENNSFFVTNIEMWMKLKIDNK